MKKVSNLQMTFATNVKFRRKKKGLTQAELAKRIGVSTSFITEIETTRKAPSFQTIEKISEVLETPAWTLFSEYSDKVRTEMKETDELLKFLLKNKISDAIEEVFR